MSSHRALRFLVGGLVILASIAIVDRPAAAAASSGKVTIALSGLKPAVAVKGSTLKLDGEVIGGSSAHSDVTIRLAVADLQVRSDMSLRAGDGSQFVYGHDDAIGSLAAGATAKWELTVPVSALSPTSQSVYALDIVADSDGERIGVTRTYLPYEVTGDSSFHATQMVVLWPVTAAPTLDGQSDKDVPEAADDSLSGQFAPNGRLAATLSAAAAAAKNVTMSLAVDPDLLATADSESHGYSLFPNGTAGNGAQNAMSWLAQAKTVLGATGGDELWQVPATDPDLGSLSRASSGPAGLMVTDAANLSANTVDGLIGRAPLGTLAWPADGQADSATLDLAKSADPSAVIVSSDSAGLHTPLESYTPTGLTTQDGEKLAVSDAALNAIFAGDPADAAAKGSDRSLLASQRFLAESALIALEEPNLSPPRTVMVAAPRDAAPDPKLLTAVGEAGWIKTVGLSTLLNAKRDPHAKTGTIRRDPAVAQSDLTSDQLQATATLNRLLHALSAIMTQPNPAVELFGPAVLRTVSTAWRSSTQNQVAFATAVQGRLDTMMDTVSLVQKSDLTLSGKSGVIPFTVENRFTNPVKVRILITTDRPGLTVQPVTVQTVPQGSTTVNVHVGSAVSGTRVRVTAQLVTPDGVPYGESQSLYVTVSSIGSITLVIFGLSAALLVVAVVLRIYRGRRTRAAQAEPEPLGASADNAVAVEAEREQ